MADSAHTVVSACITPTGAAPCPWACAKLEAGSSCLPQHPNGCRLRHWLPTLTLPPLLAAAAEVALDADRKARMRESVSKVREGGGPSPTQRLMRQVRSHCWA